jgi:hypothetical protein
VYSQCLPQRRLWRQVLPYIFLSFVVTDEYYTAIASLCAMRSDHNQKICQNLDVTGKDLNNDGIDKENINASDCYVSPSQNILMVESGSTNAKGNSFMCYQIDDQSYTLISLCFNR